MIEDTIAAISTPPGEGGIGIVRLSGPEAISIADRMFRGRRQVRQAPTHTVQHGHVTDPEGGEDIEEVLVTVMRAPHTYTREDVVEISGHGGMFPLRRILESVLACGARLAEPGEFTRRAFLNGRIDLAQAEAVIEIIRARSDLELSAALRHLEGRLSGEVRQVRETLVQLQALLEAVLEFPEDDVGHIPRDEYRSLCRRAREKVGELLTGSEEGKILREGLRVAIVGKANVGKSSLFNALLDDDRAIVTEIPGTTRDTLEGWIHVGGIAVRLFDTAGFRQSRDSIEAEAQSRAEQAIRRADLLLIVVDGSEPPGPEDAETMRRAMDQKRVLVLNKIDLGKFGGFQELPWGGPKVEVSALKRTGLGELKAVIGREIVDQRIACSPDGIVTSLRQTEALRRAVVSLDRACQAIEEGLSEEFISLDVREALQALGEITGETSTQEILDRIFSQFCIGK
jgi:tRNA modification GTPase